LVRDGIYFSSSGVPSAADKLKSSFILITSATINLSAVM
jgi:hypothetical protein